MRVRTLKSINNLNLLLRLVIRLLSKLVEEIDRKLLTIKIIEKRKLFRNNVVLYLSQVSRGIGKILSYARCGIKEFQNIEVREKINSCLYEYDLYKLIVVVKKREFYNVLR